MSEVSILTQIQKDEELFNTLPEVERINLIRELRSSVQILAMYQLKEDPSESSYSPFLFYRNARAHR